tara:strand:+ start:525 stop:1736 length:1212 start_codon:yes stop_codon:yes gene_type:complete
MAAYVIGDDENDKQSAIDKVMRDKASPDWYGDGIEGRYGGGVDPEIQGMYEFIAEYGPLAGAAGVGYGLRALKSQAPRLMNWFKSFIKKGGTPKEAKLAEKLQKMMSKQGSRDMTKHTDLQKWEKKVREIEKGWAKEKGVKMPKGVSKEWRQPLSSPWDDVSKEISPYLSVKGAAKAGSSRQRIQDFMGEALRKKPLKVKGEVEQINKWIDANWPPISRRLPGRSGSRQPLPNQADFDLDKAIAIDKMRGSGGISPGMKKQMTDYSEVLRKRSEYIRKHTGTPAERSGVMAIPPGRGPVGPGGRPWPSEDGTSMGKILGGGAGILGITSLVHYLADERMRAADERARQERGNIDPYPSPYKVDDVESRSNRERLLDRGSIKPAPAPRVNPLKYLIEEEGGFLE